MVLADYQSDACVRLRLDFHQSDAKIQWKYKKTQITNPTINGDVSARVRISINQMQPTVAAPSPPAHFVITCVLIIPFIYFVIVFTYILGFHPFC